MKLETWFVEINGKTKYRLKVTLDQFPQEPFIEKFDEQSALIKLVIKLLMQEKTRAGTDSIKLDDIINILKQ